jgi:hypothetical protein
VARRHESMNMPESNKSLAVKERIRWALIGSGLRVLAILLMRTGRKDPWLDRALKELKGIYRFESADARFFRLLVLKEGKVKMARNLPDEADFTFTIYEPSALGLRTRPENILEVVIGNKIGQSGNIYHLYQFGFIMSLLERNLRRRM